MGDIFSEMVLLLQVGSANNIFNSLNALRTQSLHKVEVNTIFLKHWVVPYF